MRPEDVPAEWVEKALNTRLPSGGLPTLNEPQMRAILAAVLPDIQAQALREEAYRRRGDGSNLPVHDIATTTRLRLRAARLTATTEEPTP